MKPVASNDLVTAAKYEWAKRYKTDIPESRLRKELGPLGNEESAKVLSSLRAFMQDTPAKFFSWTKWRDTWMAHLPRHGPSPSNILSGILTSHTGYAPSIGTYWTLTDIRKKHGDAAAEAIERIGGVKRLQNMAADQRKWIEKEFVEAYGHRQT